MEREKLYNEITSDPLGRGYTDMTDAEVAKDGTQKYRTREREITSLELLEWAGQRAVLPRLRAVQDNPDVPIQIRGIAEAARLMIERQDASYQRERHEGLFDALVQAGVLTAEDKTALHDAYLTEPISRWTELGLGRVDWRDIREVRP